MWQILKHGVEFLWPFFNGMGLIVVVIICHHHLRNLGILLSNHQFDAKPWHVPVVTIVGTWLQKGMLGTGIYLPYCEMNHGFSTRLRLPLWLLLGGFPVSLGYLGSKHLFWPTPGGLWPTNITFQKQKRWWLSFLNRWKVDLDIWGPSV